MKFVLHILAVILTGWVMALFLPWWSLAIASFLCGWVFEQKGWMSFLGGMLGAGLLWVGMAMYIDSQTASILSSKVAALFPTKTVPLLFVITFVVSGLVGGFASLSGSIISYRKGL